MTPPSSPALVAHIAMLALISFGGMPGVLPDLHDYLVTANGWITDRDFSNSFAIVQAIPGPNMILMMSFIGWKIGGLPTAIASALVTFVPSCALAYTVFRFWDRFRDRAWQQRVRLGVAPLTIGLIMAGGYAIARSGNTGWAAIALTLAAAGLSLRVRINPLWLIAAGAVLGGSGLL